MQRPTFQDLAYYKLPSLPTEWFHGNLEAGTWVITDKLALEHQDNLNFLQKILTAAKVDWSHGVCVFALEDQESLSPMLFQNAENKSILIFGLLGISVGLQVKPPLDTSFDLGKNRFLFTHSLAEIQNNQTFKKSLWSALQNLFAL